MNRRLPFLASVTAPVLGVVLLYACVREQPEQSPGDHMALRVHTTQHSSLEAIGADTLSDSAQITALSVDPSGDALVAIIADPERQVSSALVIADERARPQLLWPDSVTRVWWPAPHRLAFTTKTGRGVRLVVDVHAADLIIADTIIPAQAAEVPWVPDSIIQERAEAFIDSLHAQPDATPQRSVLTYRIIHYLPHPRDSLVAFHTTASTTAGAESNPAWFAISRSSLTVTRIDYVIGPARELSARAATWGSGPILYYAKGRALWHAEIEHISSPADDSIARIPPQGERH